MVEILYYDEKGNEICVGDRVRISDSDDMETPTPLGVISEIEGSSIGFDEDDGGGPYWIPPIMKIRYDDGDEDVFSAMMGWFGGEKYIFEEIQKCP